MKISAFQRTYPYEIFIKSSVGVVVLNMYGISLLGVAGLNEYSPEFFTSKSIFPFPNLFPNSLSTVPVLPSGAFHL